MKVSRNIASLPALFTICMLLLNACAGANPTPAAEQPAPITAAPQISQEIQGPCPTAGEHANINGTEVTCKQNNAGNLAWIPGQNDQQTMQIQGPCPTAGEHANINGTEVTCKQNSAGNLAWIPGQSGNTGGQQSNGQAPMARLAQPCNTNGGFGFGDGGLLTCDAGKWRYALPEEAKPNADASRPAWYPDIDTQFGQSSTCKPADISFTHTVLPLDQLDASIPYGLMVGDHVTPIDHAYLGLKGLSTPKAQRTEAGWQPVTAPADGTIIEASSLGAPDTNRVVISHGCGVYTVYMVLNKLTGVLADAAAQVEQNGYVRLQTPIKAGEEFGRQRDNPLDFNVFSKDTWLTGFLNPVSYIYGEAWKPFTTDPTRFFTPELATAYSAVMQKTSEPRWGKIDHDIAGTASGNWFLQGTIGYSGHLISEYASASAMIPGGPMPGKNSYAYGHLSISPHEVDQNQWVFSTGWWQNPDGDSKQIFLVFQDGQKRPNELTSADGMVVYGLADGIVMLASGEPFVAKALEPRPVGYTITPGPSAHSVALQVNADGTLSVELLLNQPNATPTGFGPGMRVYHR